MPSFNLWGSPDGIDVIEARKQLSGVLKQARLNSKPCKCIVCGKAKTSFCNSHSVPKVFLKNIAENGMVLHVNGLLGIEYIDIEKGVNSSGTFQFICNECDSILFQDYEDVDKIKDRVLDDRLLAEIALKNVLLMLSKRNIERAIYKQFEGKINGIEAIYKSQELDERDFKDEMDLYLRISNTSSNSFKVVYHTILPYRVPIAVQTPLVIQKDLDGVEINDIYDFSENTRIQNMHIAVFPLTEETVVIMFYHRRDKNYRRLLHQFNCLSSEDKLRYINYYIFKYTENYFLSPSLKETIDKSPKLIQLSRENNELPNLGYVNMMEMVQYRPVKIEDIPNLLVKDYAIFP